MSGLARLITVVAGIAVAVWLGAILGQVAVGVFMLTWPIWVGALIGIVGATVVAWFRGKRLTGRQTLDSAIAGGIVGAISMFGFLVLGGALVGGAEAAAVSTAGATAAVSGAVAGQSDDIQKDRQAREAAERQAKWAAEAAEARKKHEADEAAARELAKDVPQDEVFALYDAFGSDGLKRLWASAEGRRSYSLALRETLEKFQRENGLSVTGLPDAETWKLLSAQTGVDYVRPVAPRSRGMVRALSTSDRS